MPQELSVPFLLPDHSGPHCSGKKDLALGEGS